MASAGLENPVDERAAEVRRILESRTFHNSEVLKRLLDYLARQALEHPGDELKEYTVGIGAFGKPADYDPKTDSSVRVLAGKLRQKLDEYYRTEGVGRELMVELPKGHFKLEFRPVQAPAAAVRRPRRGWMLAAAGMVAMAALGWWLSRPKTGWNSEMEEIWRPFLASSRPVVVVVGAPLFTKLGGSFFRDPTVNTPEAAGQSSEVQAVEKALGTGPGVPAFNYTGVGEAAGALAIERLLAGRGRDLSFRFSNQLAWEDIARNNVIFLGPPKYNQQTIDLPVRQDFEVSHAHVQNLRPAPGEPAYFEEKWAAGRSYLEEGHALISRLPGLHRTGELMILAGSSTECTRAAAEYVTRAEYVAPFVGWMREHGGVPAWFQVVIRARFKAGTPIAIERVAFRALR